MLRKAATRRERGGDNAMRAERRGAIGRQQQCGEDQSGDAVREMATGREKEAAVRW